MNWLMLFLFGLICGAMVLVYLLGKPGKLYEFPFWMGILGLGWFFPMALGGFRQVEQYPLGAYFKGLLFASICMLALWRGFCHGRDRVVVPRSWLDASFDVDKLYFAGAFLCLAGSYFGWKLSSLPDEMLAQTQWSGATVKYLFLASVGEIGFLILWLLYLSRGKLLVPKLLIFIVPHLLLMVNTAVIKGRRAGMMNLVAYVLISLWFTRRWFMPRWMMVAGLVSGILIVNSIEFYRVTMSNKEASLKERLATVATADLTKKSDGDAPAGGFDFNNYIFYRQVIEEEGAYNFGLSHWNGFVWNYVPAQIIGKANKRALMIPSFRPHKLAEQRYDHHFKTGTVSTGYTDAFGSFGWLGFLKFGLIGWIMGTLYRHAMNGHFLGQLLYVYLLSSAMHSISHGTQAILVSNWVYFFGLGYPALLWARTRQGGMETSPDVVLLDSERSDQNTARDGIV